MINFPNLLGFFTIDNKYVPYDVENRSTPPFRTLDFCFDSRGLRILQSCNGLLLCCSNIQNRDARKFYVFNPTTKQYAIIEPVPGGYNARKTICFMGLAFHQTDCVHYKLVCVRHLEPDGAMFHIDVYSYYTGKWKICTETFYADWCLFFGRGVYWNGAIHWVPSYHNHFYFSIETEQLQMLPLRVGMTSSKPTLVYYGESRAHLHMIVADDYYKTSLHVDVYEMLSDHSGWFVKYQLQLDGLPGAFLKTSIPPRGYDFKVIDVVRGEKEEDTFMVLLISGLKIITYNLHDKSFKETCSLTEHVYYAGSHRYTETLSSF